MAYHWHDYKRNLSMNKQISLKKSP